MINDFNESLYGWIELKKEYEYSKLKSGYIGDKLTVTRLDKGAIIIPAMWGLFFTIIPIILILSGISNIYIAAPSITLFILLCVLPGMTLTLRHFNHKEGDFVYEHDVYEDRILKTDAGQKFLACLINGRENSENRISLTYKDYSLIKKFVHDNKVASKSKKDLNAYLDELLGEDRVKNNNLHSLEDSIKVLETVSVKSTLNGNIKLFKSQLKENEVEIFNKAVNNYDNLNMREQSNLIEICSYLSTAAAICKKFDGSELTEATYNFIKMTNSVLPTVKNYGEAGYSALDKLTVDSIYLSDKYGKNSSLEVQNVSETNQIEGKS